MMGVINVLLDKPSLTTDEKDFLDLLGILVEAYENSEVELPVAINDKTPSPYQKNELPRV